MLILLIFVFIVQIHQYLIYVELNLYFMKNLYLLSIAIDYFFMFIHDSLAYLLMIDFHYFSFLINFNVIVFVSIYHFLSLNLLFIAMRMLVRTMSMFMALGIIIYEEHFIKFGCFHVSSVIIFSWLSIQIISQVFSACFNFMTLICFLNC